MKALYTVFLSSLIFVSNASAIQHCRVGDYLSECLAKGKGLIERIDRSLNGETVLRYEEFTYRFKDGVLSEVEGAAARSAAPLVKKHSTNYRPIRTIEEPVPPTDKTVQSMVQELSEGDEEGQEKR